MNIKILFSLFILCFLTASCNKAKETNINTPPPNVVQQKTEKPEVANPIESALLRAAKKPFGIYITKKGSPVQPEKFSGYHTGTDFETTPEEKDTEIKVFAACDGKLLVKKYATGYGGVVVQSCKFDQQDITVIYGHISLSSVTAKAGDTLHKGDLLATLGKGYSKETDGERKHLHFGIHRGNSINILGYVQNKSDLENWLNPIDYLK